MADTDSKTGIETPTQAEIHTRVAADLNAKVTGADAQVQQVRWLGRFWRSALWAIGYVLSVLTFGLYRYGVNIAREAGPDAEGEEGVERWANSLGLTRTAATHAKGSITVAATVGTVIPIGHVFTRDADAVEYKTDAAVTTTTDPQDIACTAVEAGAAGNAAAAVKVTSSTDISGLTSAATVATGGMTGGADKESVAAYAKRRDERLANPPEVGNKADYVRWVKSVGGVGAVGVSSPGASFVEVRFIEDDDDNPIPSSARRTAVEEKLIGTSAKNYTDGLAPFTDDITVVAITEEQHPFTINLEPNTTAVQTAVNAALDELLKRAGKAHIEGTDSVLELSQIHGAIDSAAGETSHVLAVPAADITFTDNTYPTRGTMTYT